MGGVRRRRLEEDEENVGWRRSQGQLIVYGGGA